MGNKVFILDDDETACRLVEKVLLKAGYTVKTQTSAIGATLAMKTFAPELVLLDVMMPAFSGDSLVDNISRLVKPRPKILFYSNKLEDELRELVDKTGVDGYVCKVAGPAALLKAVQDALIP